MNNVRGGGRWAELWADHYCVNKEFHERKAVKDSARAISGKLIRVYEKGNQTKSCERETLILLPTFNRF